MAVGWPAALPGHRGGARSRTCVASATSSTEATQIVAYSGDTTPCAGLTELAQEADVLVVECNGRHLPAGAPPIHMDEDSVRDLQAAT